MKLCERRRGTGTWKRKPTRSDRALAPKKAERRGPFFFPKPWQVLAESGREARVEADSTAWLGTENPKP